MLKYLLPVFLLTVVFNITKFFEATYEEGEWQQTTVLKKSRSQFHEATDWRDFCVAQHLEPWRHIHRKDFF
jgi:hypothetical protein